MSFTCYHRIQANQCLRLARTLSRDSWKLKGVECARNLREYKRISNECLAEARAHKKLIVKN